MGRAAYATVGLTLLAAKYFIDAAAVRFWAGQNWLPWDYFSPLWTTHARLGPALGLAMVLWAVPFIWVGTAMSVRRCRDAGLNPTWAGLAFVPILNYVLMVTLALVPGIRRSDGAGMGSPNALGVPITAAEGDAAEPRLALLRAASVGALVAMPLVLVLAQVAARYSASLFVGGPFAVGTAAGWQLAARGPVSRSRLAALSVVTGAIAGSALLLFALEGLVCVAMVIPLALPLVFMGTLLGSELRGRTGRSARRVADIMPALLLPFVGAFSSADVGDHQARSVVTQMAIAAPRQTVWRHVVAFGELPRPTSWMFRLGGIAYPQRATIVGQGIGAVRHCQFNTGAFVEPITDWRPGERLAFDVTQSPPSMHEWSPYPGLNPPHVEQAFLSRAGSFLLEEDGRGGTLLTGTTAYTMALEPSFYWHLWADYVVHHIHLRVLAHVKSLSEAS